MKKKLLMLSSILSVAIISIIFAASVAALGISPAKIVLEVSPGDTLTKTVTLFNTEPVDNDYDFIPVSVEAIGGGNFNYLKPESARPPYSAQDWITVVPDGPIAIPANDKIQVNLSFDIPSDVQSGTYYAGINMTKAQEKKEMSGVGVAVTGRVRAFVQINVLGEDAKGELSFDSFELNKEKLLQDVISFDATFSNTGNLALAPTGKLIVLDAEGNQVKNLIRTVEEINGELVTKNFQSEVAFNPGYSTIAPGDSRTISLDLKNSNLNPDTNYTAKLSSYYVVNGNIVNFENKEANFILDKEYSDIQIDNFETAGLAFSTPIDFSGSISNTGNAGVKGKWSIEIKNSFGKTKEVISGDEEVLIEAQGQYSLEKGINWTPGFALGKYTANLIFAYDNGESSIINSVDFWVFIWWQAVIAILVFIAIILLVAKAVKSYFSMKKKLQELEK